MGKPKSKFEVLTGKVTELKKKDKEFDGGDSGIIEAEHILIERAVNGYIIKFLAVAPEEDTMIEATLIAHDKDELFETLKQHI